MRLFFHKTISNSLNLKMNYSWKNLRIEIQSERIKAIRSHSEICFRTNQKNVLNLNRFKSVKNQFDLIWDFNPNHSDLGFIQIENLLSINLNSDYSGLIFNQFASYEIQHFFRIGSKWLGFSRIEFVFEISTRDRFSSLNKNLNSYLKSQMTIN